MDFTLNLRGQGGEAGGGGLCVEGVGSFCNTVEIFWFLVYLTPWVAYTTNRSV